jgi:CHAT domain-containing protein
MSAAAGALAGVYLLADRRDDALTLTLQAIFEAQSAEAADLLFRWHWQAARIQRAQSDPDRALVSYRHALAVYETRNLALAKPVLTLTLREPAHAVYLEFADLLLQKSGMPGNSDGGQKYLIEARDAVEKLKAGELQDYFRDSCVAEARVRVKGLVQSLGAGIAVLYPIVLPDRLELLLDLGTEIKRYTIAENEAAVLEAAHRFRDTIESQRTRSYLAPAQTLYRWLIAPLQADLAAARITTLVTVPDHTLRAIPMAALHDGEHFLVERLAVVMAPGLELIDPRPLPSGSASLLLTGLSRSVQGFPALEHVETELSNIRGQFSGRTLKNEAFVRGELEQALTRQHYNIAHIASHGEFSGDVRASFVLAYDGKVSVDELARFIGFNRFRDDPLDLLTLSACQTAAGDERAALGLAGITVKAGARSALASLWPIHDEATSLLMTEFYRQLGAPGVSKAQALQRAQQKLTKVTRYRHPGYWSGFVLIGNWL